jgi:hypothetical protein
VIRGYARLFTENITESAICQHMDTMVAESARPRPMPVMADHLWKMLMKAAAVGDIDELRTATDSNNRQLSAERGSQDRQLTMITLGLDAGGLGMRPAAIHRWIDIVAPADHEPVEPGHSLLGMPIVGWQQDWPPPRSRDCSQVDSGQQGRRLPPHTPARIPLDTNRHADQRPRQSQPPGTEAPAYPEMVPG